MKMGITGKRTTIVQELLRIIPSDTKIVHAPSADELPCDLDRYVLAAGYLAGKRATDIGGKSARLTRDVNYLQPVALIERTFRQNPSARICVIGSESAYTGSYDMTYARSKLDLHRYVETKKLLYPEQQLVCVSPTIIKDSGMTQRRPDKGALRKRERAHPKQRWLTACEVARLVHFCLFVDEGYLSGTVIRMHGSAHGQ